jgi:hypothetical protein
MKSTDEVLKKWMKAINDKNIEQLLALYDEKAVLIPTFSNRILNSPAKIRDYFEKLGSRDDLSLALHEKTVITQKVAETTQALSGIYGWRFALEGEILSFEARFSYFMDLSLKHPIIHHHSSQIPRML